MENQLLVDDDGCLNFSYMHSIQLLKVTRDGEITLNQDYEWKIEGDRLIYTPKN